MPEIVTASPVQDMAPRGQASCSIVIVSWNTRELLAQCLESLRNTHDPETHAYEVVVVDNDSKDGSPELIRARFPWVHLIANSENVGFARANNQAIRMTTADYVLLLNPDTIVQPNAVRALMEFMEHNPGAGAAGANLRNPDGTQQDSCFPEPSLRREIWRLLHLDAIYPYSQYVTRKWQPPRVYPVDVVQGTCALFRRAALDEVGTLDEDYFIYSEEVDLCTRLRKAGWTIHWVPAARIIHFGGQSTRQCAEEMFLRLYHSKITYFRKHGGPRAATAYKLILLAASLWRLCLAPVALLVRRQRRAEHLRLTANYWKLVRDMAAH
jgi:GT2 family glycosyltransferase